MILQQFTKGYRYNSDTIFLYNFILKQKVKGSVLDVGSGCGILGLLIKRDFTDIKLSQIEIQDIYAELSSKNAKNNGIDSDVIKGDFLAHDFVDQYDFIISNPPFYHSGSLKSDSDSLYLSRHSSALRFDKFAQKVYKILKPKGSFIFCYDAKQIDFISRTLLEARFKINKIQFVHVNLQKSASLVMIFAKRESKSLCNVLPPLVLYENAEYRQEVKDIFIKADTNSEDI